MEVGRAIETVSDYRLLHSQALAIGIMAEVIMANKLGYCTEQDVTLTKDILSKAKLPVEIPEYIEREVLVKNSIPIKK